MSVIVGEGNYQYSMKKNLFILFQCIIHIRVQSHLETIYVSYVQPAACGLRVAWYGWQCNLSSGLHYKGGGPSPQRGPGQAPIVQQQPYHQCANNTVSTEARAWGGQCCAVPTQVIANNCMNFDRLLKHSALNSEEYAVMFSVCFDEAV